MKRKILIIGLAALIAAPVFAELTVDDAVSRDYLKNHGYSDSNINAIRKSIARANGETLQEPVEKNYYKNPCVKFVRRFVMYLDPAMDDHSFGTDYDMSRPVARYDQL